MKSIFKYKLNLIIIALLFINSINAEENENKYYPQLEDVNPQAADVLSFPHFSMDYKYKINTPEKKYEIFSEKKIIDWARAQGFMITRDHNLNGLNYKRGAVFFPPGLSFNLYVPKNDFDDIVPFGWTLVIDMGFLKSMDKIETLSSDFLYYQNILRYDIYIDNIHYKTIEIGYGKTQPSLIQISIPFIRDKEGKILVDIKIPNTHNSFGVLYDAILIKEKI
ncbi:MAG: hypothetical protein OEZ22_02695 [Spirochaetia bacterium]|nr:hypothetical protein [Spirochaetia bacterium]